MDERDRDLFARRNRLRIVGLVVLATLNYCLAVCAAAVATGLAIVIWAISEGAIPDSVEALKFFGIAIAVVIALSLVIGIVVAVVRLPFQRSRLERRVLAETQAQVAQTEEHRRVANLLEGLAIAAGVPPPRFAIIPDACPNSFGVGTRPGRTIIGVTTGLVEKLDRAELEAVLAYEVSRIGSWDIALASWTVALTGGAIETLEGDDLKRLIIGYLPLKFAEWLQLWALRDQGHHRDRVAVRFTRQPQALLRALEKLDADASQIGRVSRATAPLWVEFPARVVAGSSSRATQRLARELLLDERIEDLRRLAGPVAATAPPPTGPPVGLPGL